MSEFDDWYYTTDKCDTRFDKGPEKNAYYKCKETWDYQQAKLDFLQKMYDNLSESYDNLLKKVSPD